jgi:hypothetical protein
MNQRRTEIYQSGSYLYSPETNLRPELGKPPLPELWQRHSCSFRRRQVAPPPFLLSSAIDRRTSNAAAGGNGLDGPKSHRRRHRRPNRGEGSGRGVPQERGEGAGGSGLDGFGRKRPDLTFENPRIGIFKHRFRAFRG